MSISPWRYATATASCCSILTDTRVTLGPLAAPAGAPAPSVRPEQRVNVDAVHTEAPVQVRAGREAGAADPADGVAFAHALAGGDVDLGHVHVEGQNSHPVIQDHGIPAQRQRLGQSHDSAVG